MICETLIMNREVGMDIANRHRPKKYMWLCIELLSIIHKLRWLPGQSVNTRNVLQI